MYTAMTPAEMRQVVLSRFQSHRSQDVVDRQLEEHARVEKGKVIARCYRADNLFAMWMIEIGLVQFYDDQGNMFHTLDLFALTPERKRAA